MLSVPKWEWSRSMARKRQGVHVSDCRLCAKETICSFRREGRYVGVKLCTFDWQVKRLDPPALLTLLAQGLKAGRSILRQSPQWRYIMRRFVSFYLLDCFVKICWIQVIAVVKLYPLLIALIISYVLAPQRSFEQEDSVNRSPRQPYQEAIVSCGHLKYIRMTPHLFDWSREVYLRRHRHKLEVSLN